MAKPIRATPTLVGKEALVFLEKMKQRERISPSKADIQLIKIIDRHSKLFRI
ncbi:MAG: hypothetical protein QT03_C0001G0616 [archaeon GW2011_AR10]|nr:MAG: hypothetical protein QT03_C0001G0616 [archaeon GW2011_AR10]